MDLVLLAARPPLPDLPDPVAVAALRELVLPVDLARFATDGLPAHTAVGLVAWCVPLVILLAGVADFRRQARSGGPATSGRLAVAVRILVFAQAQTAIAPTAFTGIVSWFDIFLLAAVTAAFLGQVAEEQADRARLRRAILAEERLRAVRTERAVLDVRLRIAREVHDGLRQSVWLLRMRVESLLAAGPSERTELADATREGLGAIEEDARLLVEAMRRIEPAEDLARALADVVREVMPEGGPEVRIEVAGPRPPVLAPEVLAELRGVAREALVNVLRHADATLVRIADDGGGGAVSLAVTDTGRGFVPERRAHGHYGIAGMEERVRVLGGTLEIRSGAEEGTTVRATIPIAPTVDPEVPA
ncbi:MAG: sensor histidine kinase [Chloroflexota bacterium]